MEIILLSVLALIIADFITQTNKIINNKLEFVEILLSDNSKNRMGKKKNKKKDVFKILFHGFIMHGIHLLFLLIMLLSNYNFISILMYSLLLTITHVIIDFLKEFLNNKKNPLLSVFLFLVEQVIHVLVIINLAKIFEFTYVGSLYKFMVLLLNPTMINMMNNIIDINLISLAIFFGYIVFGGAYLIPLLFNVIFGQNFNTYSKEKDEAASAKQEGTKDINIKTGKIIGILERSIMFLLLLGGNYSTIGFTIAAKSLARFDLINKNRYFAEYYLIGSLISILITIIGYKLYTSLIF